MKKPNIVYILADDMGYGDMACNNPASGIPTPHLDRLAAQGMRFTDAHAASSVCTPSRYSILTGRYCWRTPLKQSVLWEWDPPLIEPGRLTVASLLRDNGYRTACIGKWHLGWEWPTRDGRPVTEGLGIGEFNVDERYRRGRRIDYGEAIRGGPVDCGFDSYFGVDVPNFPPYAWFEGDRLTALPVEEKPESMFGHPGVMTPGWKLEAMIPAFVDRARSCIAQSGPDPFFLYMALTSPHTPIVPNAEFLGRSGAGRYGDFVCEVDWVVGQIMEALDKRGIAENTLLIFTSDNGPENIAAAEGGAYERIRRFNHSSMAHLRGVKRDTWEGGHRVPFVVRWPDAIPAGSICDRLVSLQDLIATCADMLDVTPSGREAEDSISMLPLLRGQRDAVPRTSVVHHSGSGRFALRKDHWVFIDAPSGSDHGEPAWFTELRGYVPHDDVGELFDLREDIAERTNLYRRYPEKVRELAAELKRIMTSHGAAGDV